MAIWNVIGGNRLEGVSFVQGSKNAVLPILAASIAVPTVTELMNVPVLSDVSASLRILRHLGCTAEQDGNDVYIDSTNINNNVIPREMTECMRSSVLFMGALLARCGEANISLPGGCNLGSRPVDMHVEAMRKLGAETEENPCELVCKAESLEGSTIDLPFPSVGATENAILASIGAKGETVIKGAAKEPEIIDLQEYLRKAGVYISGCGTDTVRISGVSSEKRVGHRIIPDRMAASTLLCAAAACGGDIELRGVDSRHILSLRHFLNYAGCDIIPTRRSVRLISNAGLHAVDGIVTEPYPGFPTDSQPLLMAALLKAEGKSTFTENVFDNRFLHAKQLARFGADISIDGRNASVWGVKSLKAATVTATDLRGGAAMIIAGMCAEGKTQVLDDGHIERGYEELDRVLRSLGGQVYTER